MQTRAKTWGPFTGRQLTTMVCVALVVFLFPVGAWALSFSNVAITDPGGVNQARVNSSGALVVNGNVTGNVTPAPPSRLVRIKADVVATPYCRPAYTVPAGSTFILTASSAGVQKVNVSVASASIGLYRNATGACTELLNVAATSDRVATVANDFGSGIAIPSGSTISTAAIVNATGVFYLWGYLAPAT